MVDSSSPTVGTAAAVAIVTKEAMGLLHKFLGPSAKEAGSLLADEVRIFRLKRQVSLMHKAARVLAECGQKPKLVKLKILLPLLEAGGLEDDEEMSDRWASLLAAAADPHNNQSSESAFIEILKQLSPNHAFILAVFYEQVESLAIQSEKFYEEGVLENSFMKFMEMDNDRHITAQEFQIAINNLRRLELIGYPSINLGKLNERELRVQVTSSNILCPTHLGKAFTDACAKIPRQGQRYGVPGDSISNVYGAGLWQILPVTSMLR